MSFPSILPDEEVTERLAKQSDERITPEYLQSRIWRLDYSRIAKSTTTICVIHLDNGYTVTGEASCVDPDNFDEDIGRALARKDAVAKLWPLYGFLLAEKRYLARKSDEPLTEGLQPT